MWLNYLRGHAMRQELSSPRSRGEGDKLSNCTCNLVLSSLPSQRAVVSPRTIAKIPISCHSSSLFRGPLHTFLEQGSKRLRHLGHSWERYPQSINSLQQPHQLPSLLSSTHYGEALYPFGVVRHIARRLNEFTHKAISLAKDEGLCAASTNPMLCEQRVFHSGSEASPPACPHKRVHDPPRFVTLNHAKYK